MAGVQQPKLQAPPSSVSNPITTQPPRNKPNKQDKQNRQKRQDKVRVVASTQKRGERKENSGKRKEYIVSRKEI